MTESGTRRYPHAGGWVPRPRTRVAQIELEGEALLYEDRIGALHALNPIAALIWGEFDGRRSLDEIAGQLGNAFHMDPVTIREDLVTLTTDLVQRGLLELVEEDGAGPAHRHGGESPETPAAGTPGEHRFLHDPQGG